MRRLVRLSGVVDDPFVLVRDAVSLADLPEATPVIVPLALWTSARAALVARGDAGVWLAPADDPESLAADVRLLPVIAVDFPAFTDGRGYSIGRLLRERYGYSGELRAVGDVQRDQLYYLAQVGFNAFAVRDDRDADAALAGLTDFSDGYQLTNARAPWFRRRAAAEKFA
ncbi:MAG: DUF934 domain-containing protein [Burkholderiales bacterium]